MDVNEGERTGSLIEIKNVYEYRNAKAFRLKNLNQIVSGFFVYCVLLLLHKAR